MTDHYQFMLEGRGVETPCNKCAGFGVRAYGSTATWHGGMGGCTVTSDVCDHCWGSGDENHHWLDLRQLKSRQRQMDKDQAFHWLAQEFGLNLPAFKKRFAELADICTKQANKRKLPEDEKGNEFWWHNEWTAVSSLLRKLSQ